MIKLVRVSLAALCLTALAGCTLPYYWQAAAGHFDLVRKRVPIETVLQDPEQPAAVKQTLQLVLDMRQFAVDELALPDNKSYRSYVDLERPYVVWNVVAAGEFAVDPKQWCFALLGCVSYRGYFDRQHAEDFAASLRADGMETYVAGAIAYSTLGYFADPVLNTMLAGGEPYIAGILFHELAHQKFYMKGESDLNEAFASAVQQHGTQLWLMRHGSGGDVEAFNRRLGRQADFTALIAAQRERLAAIYASVSSAQSMRVAKQAAFEQMREDYARYRASWGGVTDYDAWFSQPINNAQLASVTTYRRWLPGMLWYLERYGLADLYAQMQMLEQLSSEDREQRLEAWLAEAVLASRAASGPARVRG
jgi:predicted aminopeptidase